MNVLHPRPASSGDRPEVAAEKARRVEIYRRQWEREGRIAYLPRPTDPEIERVPNDTAVELPR